MNKINTKKYSFDWQRGAIALLISFFVMTIMLLIGLTAASIMVIEIKMSRDIANSIPAFFAADAGAERCLYQARCIEKEVPTAECGAEAGVKPNYQLCAVVGGFFEQDLDNTASLRADRVGAGNIEAWGEYQGTRRRVDLDWPTP